MFVSAKLKQNDSKRLCRFHTDFFFFGVWGVGGGEPGLTLNPWGQFTQRACA